MDFHIKQNILVAASAMTCMLAPAMGAKEAPASKGHKNADQEIDAQTLKKWSASYRGWHYHPDHVIAANPKIKGFEKVNKVDVPTVYQIAGDKKWYMTFIGFDGKGYQSFVSESDDLVNWTNRRLAMGYGPKGEFDHGGVVLGAFLYQDYDIKAPRTLKKRDGKYYSLYGAYPRQGGYELRPGYEGIDFTSLLKDLGSDQDGKGRFFLRLSRADGSDAVGELHECAIRSYGPKGGLVRELKLDIENGRFGESQFTIETIIGGLERK